MKYGDGYDRDTSNRVQDIAATVYTLSFDPPAHMRLGCLVVAAASAEMKTGSLNHNGADSSRRDRSQEPLCQGLQEARSHGIQ
jgi:hypothetical protein